MSMIDVPVVTRANARCSDPLAGIETTGAFAEQVSAIPWFSRVAQPSEWDRGAVRLRQWTEWPGPDDEGTVALASANQAVYDAAYAEATRIGRAEDFRSVFQRLHDLTREHAKESAIAFDPEEDAWHAPTQSVWDAAYCGGLIGCFVELAWGVPEDLQELWAWFQRGHWPCGYTHEPAAGPRTLRVL